MTNQSSKRILLKLTFVVMGTCGTLPFSVNAQQAFPTKPIRLIVGFAPGGGTDIVARAIAPKMSEILGQSVIIENKSGAAGTIGADLVAKSNPDGHTLLMGHSNSNAISPYVLKNVPYNPATDFTPITYLGYVPNVLVVKSSASELGGAINFLGEAKPRADDLWLFWYRQYPASSGRFILEDCRRRNESRTLQR